MQTLDDLNSSFRNWECRGHSDGNCGQKGLTRRSSGLLSVSTGKLLFDISQLTYLLSLKETAPSHGRIQEALTGAREFLPAYIKRFTATASQMMRLIPKEAIEAKGTLNRAIYISPDETWLNPSEFIFQGALNKMKNAGQALAENDFLVLDVILQKQTLAALSDLLLRSTIWFDVSNGISFVSHCNDGLVHPSFGILAKLVAHMLSVDSNKPASVSKYFTIAMDDRINALSPVMMANANELIVVLWLNQRDSETGKDGLHVFDSFSSSTLFSQGISLYKTVHPDFLSTAGNVAVDVFRRCPSCTAEFVPRIANRMAVVGPLLPVVLKSDGASTVEGLQEGFNGQGFLEHTMLAFVVVLSQQR